MDVSPGEIKTRVRSILTRHWLDVNKITIIVGTGTVRLAGTLQKLPGAQWGQSTQHLLEVLDGEIRGLKGVTRVHVDLAE